MATEDAQKTAAINDFTNRCFRDVADQDYLAARAAYRAGLVLPVLTNGHQALEKYLKAILLYNRKSTKSIGHDLEKAFGAVLSISDISLIFQTILKRQLDTLNDVDAVDILRFHITNQNACV